MLPLLALSRVNWRRVGIAGATGVVVVLVTQVWLQHVALREAELAYQHPRVETRLVKVRREGPTTRWEGPSRTETRTTKRPDGTEEMVRIETRGPIEEVRGPVMEIADSFRETSPVFRPAARPPRWLMGVSVADFEFGDRTAYTIWPGMTLGGRLDIEVGLDGDFETTRAKASWRF